MEGNIVLLKNGPQGQHIEGKENGAKEGALGNPAGKWGCRRRLYVQVNSETSISQVKLKPFKPLISVLNTILPHRPCIYLAVHPAQPTLLNNEITGRLQEVGAEVALLDVIILVTAVSGPGPGPDRGRHTVGLNISLSAGLNSTHQKRLKSSTSSCS